MNKPLAAVMSFGVAIAVVVPITSRLVSGQVPAATREPASAYHSPYRITHQWPREELIGDLERTERGNPRLESEVPHAAWYSERTREKWGAWGPPARLYPAPVGVEEWSAKRKRERVLAIASRYIGYAYQHHHIPDWDPPANWHWLASCAGHNGKGVDCSNFTGFVYNLGFGLKISTDVGLQAEQTHVKHPGSVGRRRSNGSPSPKPTRNASRRSGPGTSCSSATRPRKSATS